MQLFGTGGKNKAPRRFCERISPLSNLRDALNTALQNLTFYNLLFTIASGRTVLGGSNCIHGGIEVFRQDTSLCSPKSNCTAQYVFKG